MTREQLGAVLGAVLLAVAAPIVILGLVRGLNGETHAAPAQNGPTVKWEQLPDLDTTGIDVVNSWYTLGGDGYILAEDFLCTESGPITQIDFWGSWANEMYPGGDPFNVTFRLSFHADIPAGEPAPLYSHPGDYLWNYTTAPGECVGSLYAETAGEGFMEPPDIYYPPPADFNVWLFSCPIPEGAQFYQEEGNIYWLNVQAVLDAVAPPIAFGWKSAIEHRIDDGVWYRGAEPVDPDDWGELVYPLGHIWYGLSLDLSFRLWGTPPPPEACCYPDASCANEDPLTCGGVPQGPGTACTVLEACWLPDDTCIDADPLCCDDLGGVPLGPGTCSALEACCFLDGSCMDLDPLICAAGYGGTPGGGGTMCLGDNNGNEIDDACEAGLPQADLEKVDLQVKPFYCGDTDGDAYEDEFQDGTSLGRYECCNGIDDDGDTAIDALDDNCGGLTNQDGAPWYQTDDWDDQIDEDPYSYMSGQTCPWNGDDDCDGWVDEDPKNDIDDDGDCPFLQGDCFYSTLYGGCMEYCDEDPANGFLGFDNDQDGLVDEDGAGRFDFNGNTMIDACEDYAGYGPLCEDQGQGVDDDGDTMVDEDPLDSPMAVWAEEGEGQPVVKWSDQYPDLEPTGIDVDATIVTLAEDFLCTQTGEITQIDFWGSWLGDEMPYGGHEPYAGDPMAVWFDLSIHENVPENGAPFSQPGAQVWGYSIQCMAYPEGQVFYEGWLEPDIPWYDPIGDSMVWRYECPIPEGERFVQQEGEVYWLDVHAYPFEPDYFWGWKTTPVNILDAAVWNDPAAGWVPMIYPEGHPWFTWPLDLSLQIWGQGEVAGGEVYEPHYIVKEVLLNRGPEPGVWATDTKEIDAPDYRVDALEDGKNTCNDLLDNDSDDLIDADDPDCLEEHVWAESGLHACSDGLDNGMAFAEPDGLVDAEDPDCQSLTEVSVECKNPGDLITVKEDVPWYVKPPSNSDWLLGTPCEAYYDTDPDHYAKCVPCKIEHPTLDPVGPVNEYCSPLVDNPGYCIAADSTPGVYKELDIHQEVYLDYRTHNMHLYAVAYPLSISDLILQDPMFTAWEQLYPSGEPFNNIWVLTSWEDNGDGEISPSDQIDMELVESPEPGSGKAWFHVDEVTETVCLEWEQGSNEPMLCIEPLTGTIVDPIGDWHEKWPVLSETCDVTGWTDYGDLVVSPGDNIEIACPIATQGEYVWVYVYDVSWDIWLTQKVVKEHQFDLSCEGETSLHKFIIQNKIEPVEELIVDPNPENNELEMEMLVACMEWEPGDVDNLVVPDPNSAVGPPNKWDVEVCDSEIETVTVDVTHGTWVWGEWLEGAPYPSDFTLYLYEYSPGLGISNLGGDSDGDGWADKIEQPILMSSPATDPEYGTESELTQTGYCTDTIDNDDDGFYDADDAGCQTPENLLAFGTCSDGLDNDKNGLIDSLDPKCWDRDGDGYSYVYEDLLFHSDDMDATKTPEHMQFPWTCNDGIDNDKDGFCDDVGGCGAGLPPEPDDNGDDADDCSPEQLKKISPPVACASGWVPQAGDTEYVYLYGDGGLVVGLEIPLDDLYTPFGPGTVSRDLVLHCFQAANPYPTETIVAYMEPAGVHEVDLNYENDSASDSFDGEASCPDGTSDLDILAWNFTYDVSDFHTFVEETVSTSKHIHSGTHTGPLAGQPVAVLLEKWMNIPPGCDGSLTISKSETVVIPNGVWYTEHADGHEATFPDDWSQGPATLTPGNGNTVYVRGLDDPASAVEELGANYYLMLEESTSVWEDEVFDIYCREPTDPGEEVVFAFRNWLSHRYWPDECDPDISNNWATAQIVVEVPMDTDGDTVPDDSDNCMYVPNPGQEDKDGENQDSDGANGEDGCVIGSVTPGVKCAWDDDGDYGPNPNGACTQGQPGCDEDPPGEGAGDACDCDDDDDNTPDGQENRDGTDPLDVLDFNARDTGDPDTDGGLTWEEFWCGTDPADMCGDDCEPLPPPYGTDDAWHFDLNIDCWVNSSDILAFPAIINMPIKQGVIDPKPYQCRFDVDGSTWINSSDILALPANVAMPDDCRNPPGVDDPFQP